MTSFVRALDTHQKEEAALKSNEGVPSKGLTVEEIFGNNFVINFAGHDTTANTLAFSMLLLAANPKVQDWVAEEVRQVTKGNDSETWEYNELFSNLKRCRAVLVCIVLLDQRLSTLKIIFIARDSSSLSTYHGTCQMEQRENTNTPDRREDSCNTTANSSHAKPTHCPNAPQLLAGFSDLATLTLDLQAYASRLDPFQAELDRHPTARRFDYTYAKHIFPLVGRAPELPRREICQS